MKIFDMVDGFKEVKHEFELGKSHYWIHINVKEIDQFKKLILVDEESVLECKNFNQSSKISFFDNYTFMVLNILDYDKEIINSKELNIFLAKDYIVTVYKDNIEILNTLISDIMNSKNCFALKKTPKVCILLYYILDRIIVNNYDIIASLETKADEIEISILKNLKREQIEGVINLRRQVYKIRKYLSPLRYIGDSLVGNENLIIDSENRILFINLNKKVEKLMLTLESLVQDLAIVREAFESEIANRTNELMKAFTIIATIFLPLNLITSMHGMNLKGMPFEKLDNGYYYIIMAMIAISLTLIYIFKKKKWI
ncbi:dihydroorotate dehydrogenase [Clostridium fermenticellae]|uniref:Dihydroorotate dehydrogenase n=1 Tax=Clostridium fermenticellae TaxID=2068654 RepID=A0A386H3I5_9CLOT|nr:magnesium transporter CorA family protein [Clostridium fermenticellae]AYD40279.1 dihydroorotate dehydrogenase [Clostridium fermenticellae]